MELYTDERLAFKLGHRVDGWRRLVLLLVDQPFPYADTRGAFPLLHSFGRHPLHGKTLNRNVLVINLINHNEIQEPVHISFVHGE